MGASGLLGEASALIRRCAPPRCASRPGAARRAFRRVRARWLASNTPSPRKREKGQGRRFLVGGVASLPPACGGRCPEGGWGRWAAWSRQAPLIRRCPPPRCASRPGAASRAFRRMRARWLASNTPSPREREKGQGALPGRNRIDSLPPPAGEGARRADGGAGLPDRGKRPSSGASRHLAARPGPAQRGGRSGVCEPDGSQATRLHPASGRRDMRGASW